MFGAARVLQWWYQRDCPTPTGDGKQLRYYYGWNRVLQFSLVNEEFQVNASHQLALITSLPFVHTARRSPELSPFEKYTDW